MLLGHKSGYYYEKFYLIGHLEKKDIEYSGNVDFYKRTLFVFLYNTIII